MNILVNLLGRNYSMPDCKLRFPFLRIGFMSQAQGGTYFLATNQIANVGVVAMNGILKLAIRISPEGNFGISEPQFFSMSIDHAMACINVHWLSQKAESGTICFHVEKLLQYFLDVDGLKAVKRAVKNILDYVVSERPLADSLLLRRRRPSFTKQIWHPSSHKRSSCNRRTHGRGRKKMPTHW